MNALYNHSHVQGHHSLMTETLCPSLNISLGQRIKHQQVQWFFESTLLESCRPDVICLRRRIRLVRLCVVVA